MDIFSHVGLGIRGQDQNKGVGKVAIKNLSAAELSLERLTFRLTW